mmetsp:Transcript_9386/g.22530  ORF Transcript_9386/g.22530 Transcript_9386/m.22530 type:complete len:198 (-) Transcript_9386:79-672(-)
MVAEEETGLDQQIVLPRRLSKASRDYNATVVHLSVAKEIGAAAEAARPPRLSLCASAEISASEIAQITSPRMSCSPQARPSQTRLSLARCAATDSQTPSPRLSGAQRAAAVVKLEAQRNAAEIEAAWQSAECEDAKRESFGWRPRLSAHEAVGPAVVNRDPMAAAPGYAARSALVIFEGAIFARVLRVCVFPNFGPK